MEYNCNVCDKSFATYQALGGHKTTHGRMGKKTKKCSFCFRKTTNAKFCTLKCKTAFHSQRMLLAKETYPAVAHRSVNGISEYIKLDITNAELAEYRKKHNSCEICGRLCSVHKQLSVDHDHKTGKFRGLLCFKCNISLGHLEENLERATAYINKL